MKKIIVTGASGFIGRQAIPFLLEKNYEVHGVFIGEAPFLSKEVHQHSINLLDPSEIKNLMEEVKPTHLLHFAWYAIPGKYWTSPVNLDWVKSSLDMLQSFVANGGKRVVMAGTCAEYDWSKGGICSEANTPLNPHTLYGTCKASLFQIMQSFAKQTGISSAWGRIFFLYGPNEYPVRLVPDVIQSLLIKKNVKCTHGNQIRDFFHVEDVGSAFAHLVDSDLQGPINIASGEGIALKDVVNKIAQKLDCIDGVELGAIPAPANEPPVIIADANRLLYELNWKPKYTLDQGLDQAIEWWKNNLTVAAR